MKKINQIWDALLNDNTFKKGLLLRRYSGSVLPDIFVALLQPEKILCIATSISKDLEVNISEYDNLREIQVELLPDLNNADKNTLLFKLTNNQHKDIFSVLCEDLITSISLETNEKQLLRILLNRFEKWKLLFSKVVSEGLKSEEQRGLYGELYFLRKFIQESDDILKVLNSWVGPSAEIRDFQMGTWAVEVKTTHGNNHQKVHINNERQLDNTHLQNLFLYHLSLEKVQSSGETLNQIIQSIYDLISNDSISINRFKVKLYEAGYFDHHYDLYEVIGYFIRKETFYKVENDFPRIQENDLKSGVGDVKYSIVLSHCEPYIFSETDVFESIN